MTVVFDLDGVLWRGSTTLPGAATALTQLRASGRVPFYVTNNSRPRRAELVERLQAIDPEVTSDLVVTSSDAAAASLPPSSRALVFAMAGVHDALTDRGVVVIDGISLLGETPAVDAVVVGLHAFTYDTVARAANAVRRGARFVATNSDVHYPVEDGVLPGCGAALAAIEAVAGVRPEVCGKPHDAMVHVIQTRIRELSLDPVVAVVGDQLATDGELARQLAVPFHCVLTGVTTKGDAERFGALVPTIVSADVASAVERLGGTVRRDDR